MAKARNYKREYAQYHGQQIQIDRRKARNQSRAKAVEAGRAKKGDGKDVDHIDRNPKNMSGNNLRITSKKKNRSRNQ